ncbi:MAG: TonB family protein [Candidatus Lernaella stagnicola]|nr:TonB family protein [Candidatus Lernaella stagnicola]
MSDIFSDDVLDSIDGAIDQTMTVRTFGVGDAIAERFKVERVVGRGNFGFVYRVKDSTTGKTRALKTFYERITERPGVAKALLDLGNALAQITHPNLVRVFEVGQDGDLIFFVEEFVSAMTLKRLVSAVRKNAPEQGFPSEEMNNLLAQVTELLAEFPDLPHGNLTPQNIFMSKQGVKVSDIGVLAAVRSALQEADFGAMTGGEFWARETFDQGIVDAGADVFSLGRLLEYILTLEKPTGEKEHRPIKGGHPEALLALVEEATAHDPAERPPNAAAFMGTYEAAYHETRATEPFFEDESEARAEEDELAAAVESATEALAEQVVAEELVDEDAGELPEIETTAEPVEEVFAEDFFLESEPAEPIEQAELPLPEAEPEAPAQEAIEELPAEPEVRIPHLKREEKKGPAVAPLVAAAIVVIGLVVAFFMFQDKILPPATPQPQPTPLVDQDTFDLEGITIQPEPGGPTFDQMIGAMLTQAETYMKTNRITSPRDDSAYGIYTFVLDIDPENKVAKDGVQEVEDYYMKFGRAFLNKKDYDNAKYMFSRVTEIVNPGNKEARQAMARIAREGQGIQVATGPKPGVGPQPGPQATPQPAGKQPVGIVPPVKGIEPVPPQPLTKLTPATIRATIAKYMGRVKFCFAKNPEASGTVKVGFTINPDGSVTGTHVASSSMSNAAVEQCLVRRVSFMRFPASSGSSKKVTFPFTFKK